ncbi:hypothetical protein IV203_036325 [Nitzschia inconspicua]|uniref:Uncharacterized protein n=1 Tax=Nitzschia inconspicua TaxID=303405 RepID=A0A9K3PVN6_9STRA|nr:hypothetical protein IV203_036325 [Nitzschia inconspicua]
MMASVVTRNSKDKDSLFFSKTTGGLTPPSVAWLLAGPLILTGQFRWGIAAFVIGLIWALKLAMEQIDDSDRIEMRYNVLSPEDLMAELESLEDESTTTTTTTSATDNPPSSETSKRIKYLEGLAALAKKYNQQKKPQLALWCQQIAFTTLRLYPTDNEIVAGSISLLALIAKDTQTRKRYKFQPNDYGLSVPIDALQKTLERAKEEEDETKEELFAETLRKGCLFLGAVCNDNEDGLAIQVVQEGGLELILDAANWFRLHEAVSNWALWAIFTLAFDQLQIKVQLVRCLGIPTICELMKNNPSSLEVNRHGTALLFDLLRENPNDAPDNANNIKWDPWEVRKMALASGLHDVVFSAMNEFSDSMDIMMMGQEILIGTGFQGDVPVYQQM